MFSSFSFFAALPDLSMISLRVKNTGGTRLPDEPNISGNQALYLQCSAGINGLRHEIV
jgi:hypothetical protein